jgi:hypothetical protein
MMNKRAKLFAIACGLAVTLAAFGATGGFPSRPRFQSVGVGAAAPTTGVKITSAATSRALTLDSVGTNAGYLTLQNSGTPSGDIGLGIVCGASFTAGSLCLSGRTGFGVEMAGGGRTTPDFALTSAGVANFALPVTSTFNGLAAGPTGAFSANSAAPNVVLNESDAAANGRLWRMRADAGVLAISSLDDAQTTPKDVFTATRTGNALTNIDIGQFTDNPTVTINGTDVTPRTSSIVLSMDDACTTTPTVTVLFSRSMNAKSALITATSGFPCTADSVNFAATGTPVTTAFRCTVTNCRSPLFGNCVDNSVQVACYMLVSGSGQLSFIRAAANFQDAGWTATLNRQGPLVGTVFAYN